MKIFRLPDLGEGLPDAEVVTWHVQPGDTVVDGQTLVTVETAKAMIDIPSPQPGRIARLYGHEGDIIQTGKPLLAFAGTDDETESMAGSEAANEVESATKTAAEPGAVAESGAVAEPQAVAEPGAVAEQAEDRGTVVGEMETTDAVIAEEAIGLHHSASTVKATPAVRALANRMGVELLMVTPSGHDGLILADDVRRVARILAEHGPMQPLRGVRRAMARNMAKAHQEVVPATLVDDADITELPASGDITPRLIRALIAGCKAEPALNAWYDSHANGRRVLERIHLGLAVDAPQGLFVAVMPDIQNENDAGIVERLRELKEKINDRAIKPAEMRGFTITLSNYGAIAGRYASPVVLPPTVSILGAGRFRDEAVVIDGQIVVRRILPLALTFDHRVVTGGEAARFLQAVIEDLQL